ncbi:GATA transcription factor 26 [Zea mays]|uniref:GATA transcription factor 26 n=1 Tax=Zea mays TaxID=4577 RepID=A0A1D6E4A8_MAIZE|nr:GATA transcription factor 26 [Zea mays]
MGKQGPCRHCGVTSELFCGEMGHQISRCSAMHVARDGEQRVHWQTTLQCIARTILMTMNPELAS